MNASWPEVPMKEVAELIRGVSYPKSDSRSDPGRGYVPVLRATNIQNARLVLEGDLVYVAASNVSSEQRLRPGDIVVATSSGSKHLVGKSALLRRSWDGSFGAFCAGIRPKANVDPRYLAYFLQSPRYWKEIGKKALGVNINNLRRGDLETLLLPLPSLVEQRELVDEVEKQFSRLDEAVANLKRTKANLKRYKGAVLKAAFDAAGASEQPPSAPLDQIAEAIVDCPHSTPTWTPSGFICVRTSDFQPGHLDLRSPRYVSRETFDRRNARLVPREGDVLYSREGGILGVACVVPRDVELCLGQRMLLVRPGSRVRPRYVMHWLNSPQTLMRVRALTGGSASPHLNLRDVRAFGLSVPTLVEQDRIVEDIDRRLTIAEAIESEIALSEQRGEALMHALLNKFLADK